MPKKKAKPLHPVRFTIRITTQQSRVLKAHPKTRLNPSAFIRECIDGLPKVIKKGAVK